MDDETKIKYGEDIAEKLLAGQNLEELKNGLLAIELNDRDVYNIIDGARKIISEKIGPAIRSHLLGGSWKDGKRDFAALDSEVVQDIMKEQMDMLGVLEQSKVSAMIGDKKSPAQIHASVDYRFYSKGMVDYQIESAPPVHSENSFGSKTLSMIAGGVLIAVGIGSYFTGWFWYGGIIVGLGFIFKGFFTGEDIYY